MTKEELSLQTIANDTGKYVPMEPVESGARASKETASITHFTKQILRS
ncbi:hypothetical protein H7F15_00810 [Pontibacter sp. Tf4]|nr:hypothetical protein [Pontibacter sp. Tf4]